MSSKTPVPASSSSSNDLLLTRPSFLDNSIPDIKKAVEWKNKFNKSQVELVKQQELVERRTEERDTAQCQVTDRDNQLKAKNDELEAKNKELADKEVKIAVLESRVDAEQKLKKASAESAAAWQGAYKDVKRNYDEIFDKYSSLIEKYSSLVDDLRQDRSYKADNTHQVEFGALLRSDKKAEHKKAEHKKAKHKTAQLEANASAAVGGTSKSMPDVQSTMAKQLETPVMSNKTLTETAEHIVRVHTQMYDSNDELIHDNVRPGEDNENQVSVIGTLKRRVGETENLMPPKRLRLESPQQSIDGGVDALNNVVNSADPALSN